MPVQFPLYFDYMATTPLDPGVAQVMVDCLKSDTLFGNSASESHRYGWEARECVQEARKQVAELINADPLEIIWTSGATESDNLAIQGAAHFYQRQGRHLITMASEHKAVLDTFGYLSSCGFKVTYLNPESNGQLDLQKLEEAIRADTILVSIMHVNNETGVIQDIAGIANIVKRRGVLFHVDAAQSAGKVPIDLKRWPVDLMSLSAHKVYGPKGIGALYVRREPRVRLEAMIYGGGHERGMRSGTLATHQIMGMGTAFVLAQANFLAESERLERLKDRFWTGLLSLEGVHLNGESSSRIPGCLNIYFDNVEGESLLLGLPQLALSTGSACNSAQTDPSYVLLSMGLTREQAYNSLRISFGRFTTEAHIDLGLNNIATQVKRLRKLSRAP